ncbi:MAG: ABC transporter permease [Treponema sp.]|nr:ABC transporter permease [Treponema sp.]
MLVKRILLLFFRDKSSVFFSLLGVVIVIGLYVMFMGSNMAQNVQAALGFYSDRIYVAVAGIMFGGLVAMTSISSCMSAISVSVGDRKIAAKDFLTSPASREKITWSYIIGSGTVGFIMCSVFLILSVAYMTFLGGSLPSVTVLPRLLLTMVLSVLCGNSMVYFLSICVKTERAFSALAAVLGSTMGFMMGVFIPVGVFPNAMQWVVRLFPMSHSASMFRQVLADGELSALFANAPPEALAFFRSFFGITFDYGGFVSNFWFSAVVLAGSTALFYALSVLIARTRRG